MDQRTKQANPKVSYQLTYRGLIERLAEHPDAATFRIVRDLPELTLADLGAVLLQYPDALIEAVANFEPTATQYTAQTLADPAKTLSQTYSLIGMCLVSAVRHYVMPLVLRDVQARVERNRELDAIEELGSHFPKTGEAHELACELGLGRTLS